MNKQLASWLVIILVAYADTLARVDSLLVMLLFPKSVNQGKQICLWDQLLHEFVL